MFDPKHILDSVSDPAAQAALAKGVDDAKQLVANINALVGDVEQLANRVSAIFAKAG